MNDTLNEAIKSLRSDYINQISDDYKSLYGIRPRGYNWDKMTLLELKDMVNELKLLVSEQIAYERAEEQMHEEAMAKAFIKVPWTMGEILRLS